MFKSSRKYLLLTILLVMSVTLSACGGGGGTKDPETDELVVAQGADVKSLDPHATNDQPSTRVHKQIYDTLVSYNDDMGTEPGLAESWDQIDDLTWEFKLREGVMFHNGEEMKASDVEFTFDRMLASNEVAHIVALIESVESVDDYTVTIKTSEPFGPILSHLAHSASSILSEKAVTEAGDDYQNNPVGTGPYKFVEEISGDALILERFEDYYQGPAPIKNVRIRNIPEGTNRVIGLETGEIDIAYEVEPIDRKSVEESDDLYLVQDESLNTSYIGFNTEKEPFDDVRVRQAMNYAVDVEELIEVALEGAGTVATGPINTKVFGYNDNIDPYPYDPAKAKELLEDAGYGDGFEVELWTNDNPVRETIAEIVQEHLREIGVTVEIETVEFATYLERTAQGEHEMFVYGWITVTGDADYGLYPLFHSSQHGGSGNRAFYTNKDVDELLEIGRTSGDPDERVRVYEEVQELLVEEAPQIFLYYQDQNAAMQNYIKGFKLNPAGPHMLYNVSFEEAE